MGDILRRFLPPYRKKAVLGTACKAVEVIFDLLTPMIVARMIDDGVGGRNMSLVMGLGLLLVVLAFVGYGFTFVTQKLAAEVSQGMGTDIRNALYRQVNALGAADVDEFGTPSLVTRVTNDVNQVQVSVAYGTDMEKAMDVMANAIASHPKHHGPKPVVLCKSCDDSGVTLQALVETRDFKDNPVACSECLVEVMKRFDEEGIEIPYNKLVLLQGKE